MPEQIIEVRLLMQHWILCTRTAAYTGFRPTLIVSSSVVTCGDLLGRAARLSARHLGPWCTLARCHRARHCCQWCMRMGRQACKCNPP
eukprot:15457172-Alexandrium_andersonii.AAC.1